VASHSCATDEIITKCGRDLLSDTLWLVRETSTKPSVAIFRIKEVRQKRQKRQKPPCYEGGRVCYSLPDPLDCLVSGKELCGSEGRGGRQVRV
jgi:hypothetical protein